MEACTLELRQAQEELIRSERLATIGETVAGVAHYIKNILSGLRGGLYMVDTGFATDKTRMFQEGSSMVGRNIERISTLALDLLRYAKERTTERTVCRPNEIVAEAVELFKRKARNMMSNWMHPGPQPGRGLSGLGGYPQGIGQFDLKCH